MFMKSTTEEVGTEETAGLGCKRFGGSGRNNEASGNFCQKTAVAEFHVRGLRSSPAGDEEHNLRRLEDEGFLRRQRQVRRRRGRRHDESALLVRPQSVFLPSFPRPQLRHQGGDGRRFAGRRFQV